MYRVLIVAPSLDLTQNVSGVSAVANFIIAHNKECEYVHFLQGKRDGDGGILKRVFRIWRNYGAWTAEIETLSDASLRNADATIRGDATTIRHEGAYDTERGSYDTAQGAYDNENEDSEAGQKQKQIQKEKQKDRVDVDKVDIIHYNFPLDALSIVRDFFFMRAAYKRGMRMVVHEHGGLYLFKERKPLIIERMLKEVFSWECPFIVLSEKEKEQILRLYGTKNVEVLPNCVDLRYDTLSDTLRYDTERGSYDTAQGAYDTLRYENSLTPDPSPEGEGSENEKVEVDVDKVGGESLEILYLGRIEKNKGMDDMLMAMKVLMERGRRFVLHFAGIEQGRNGYIKRFEDVLGDRFVYEGVVSGDRKMELMRRCEVFLLPSLYEGLPMSLLETMGCGMVPVVTDVGSISEYVKDGVNGLMIGVKDAQSIVDAIEKLGSDGTLLRKLSANARETIAERCNPVQYIEKLNAIYDGLGG